MMACYLQNQLMESVQTVWYRLQIYEVRKQLRHQQQTKNDREPCRDIWAIPPQSVLHEENRSPTLTR